jgi:hypothetical protein
VTGRQHLWERDVQRRHRVEGLQAGRERRDDDGPEIANSCIVVVVVVVVVVVAVADQLKHRSVEGLILLVLDANSRSPSR